jgi:hypothetical protein
MLRHGLSRQLFRILNNSVLEPVDLLEIQLVGSDPSSTIRLVGNYGANLTWNGNAYTPCSISHGEIQDVLAAESGSVPSVTVVVSNVDLQVARLLNAIELERAKATLRVLDRRRVTASGDAMVITVGEIANPTVSDEALIFEIENVVGILERVTLPRRLFQSGCNYTFGSRACGVDVQASPNQIATTAQAGSTKYSVVVPGGVTAVGGSDPTLFWANGYLWMIDGPAAPQARPIQRVDAGSNRFYLQRPFLKDPGVGSNLVVRRVCKHNIEDCVAIQGNADNYGGYPDVPFGRIRPKLIKDEPTTNPHNAF